MTTSSENGQRSELLGMQTPPTVSAEEWKAAWEQLHVKEKAHSRARDALAAERRRMPWLAVEKEYAFIGPKGNVSLLDLFGGRRQLIVYRAFFEHDLNVADPGVVVPALFQLVYDPATDPAYKHWHARRVQGMPAHVVRESFGPLFFGAGQVGIGEASAQFCRRLTVPFYHLCRDAAQADRMRPWFSHPKSKVDAWSNAGHWIMLDRRDDVNAAVTAWIDAL